MKKKNILYLFLLLISFISMAYVLPKVSFENDTFYSIKIGESIVKYGIDMIDHFSWIPNLAYTYPHWLFDTIIYGIYNIFGYVGIYAFVIISFLTLLFLMYYCSKKISGNNYLSFLVVLFLGMSLSGFATARAQLITYPLLLVVLYSINISNNDYFNNYDSLLESEILNTIYIGESNLDFSKVIDKESKYIYGTFYLDLKSNNKLINIDPNSYIYDLLRQMYYDDYSINYYFFENGYANKYVENIIVNDESKEVIFNAKDNLQFSSNDILFRIVLNK